MDEAEADFEEVFGILPGPPDDESADPEGPAAWMSGLTIRDVGTDEALDYLGFADTPMGIMVASTAYLEADDVEITDIIGTGVMIIGEASATLTNADLTYIYRPYGDFALAEGVLTINAMLDAEQLFVGEVEGPGLLSLFSQVTCSQCQIDGASFAGVLSVGDSLTWESSRVCGVSTDDVIGGGAGFVVIGDGVGQATLTQAELCSADLGALYVTGRANVQVIGGEILGTGDDISGEGPWGNPIVAVSGRPPDGDIPGPERWDDVAGTGLLVQGADLVAAGGTGIFLSGASITIEETLFDGFSTAIVQQGCADDIPGPEIDDATATVELCPRYDHEYLYPFLEISNALPEISD